jgi:hypothetical protein
VEAVSMSLIRWIERPYVYIFYVLIKSLRDEWRAALVLNVLQFTVITGIACGVALITGHRPISIPKPAVLVECIAVYAITHSVLTRKHRWRQFEVEFEQYSKTKSDWARIGVWVGVVTTFLVGVAIIKTAIGARMI